MSPPSDPQLHDLILAKIRSGDLAGARTDCEHALASGGGTARRATAHFWLGVVAQRSDALPAAIEQFERSLQADGSNPQTFLQLGIAHLQRQDFDRAEICFREAIARGAAQPLAHYNLGIVLQYKKNLPAARAEFESALAVHPQFAEAMTNLANVLVAMGDDRQASQYYERALATQPGLANAHYGLGLLHRHGNRHDAAMQRFEAAVHYDPDLADAWLDLAELRYTDGNTPGALACVDEVLKRDPGSETGRFKRAQFAGEQPGQMPATLVEHLYDGMAATYDEHLTQHLHSHIPELINEALLPWLTDFSARSDRKAAVLDLGCGTGLFGVAVRPNASTLVGVDLSSAMLAKAAERGIYDALVQSDLVAYLRRDPHASPSAPDVDLIAASDVLIYLGDLKPLFERVAFLLPAGGRFVFSLEKLGEAGLDYRLESSGRYAHHPDYIRRLTASTGLTLQQSLETDIRSEGGHPIKGCLFVLEKR